MCSFLIRTEFGHKTSIYPQILVLFAYIQIFVQLGHIIDICSPCSPKETGYTEDLYKVATVLVSTWDCFNKRYMPNRPMNSVVCSRC